jgi:hypothetical protein
MGAIGIVVTILVVVIVVGGILDFLHLFGIYIPEIPLMLLTAAVVAAAKWKTIARTFDYLFVTYPIDTTLNADTAGAMPAYRSENTAERSRALKEKLDADAEIAQATLRRERARAALADAEQEVEEVQRRSERRP